MDQSKKQTLTPELKQIYDRVMNTQVENKVPSTPAPVVPAPTTPVPSTPLPPSPVIPPVTNATMGSTTTPPASHPAEPEAPKSAMKITPPPGGAPANPAMGADKTFVFSGNKVTTPQGSSTVKVATGGGGKGMSGVVIAGLVVLLLAVWGIFWAKLLGII